MIHRVGAHTEMRQRDEEMPTSRSDTSSEHRQFRPLPAASGVDLQTPQMFETSTKDGSEDVSLELEDLWNMIIASDAWMTQATSTTGDPATMCGADHSAA